ncbi:hypothetical protein [Pseudomonas putida]|uniref:hypothetical protein n=1 Tax=Pseudomonas putida TaxID=303 RepID=UPI001F51B14B|nr:hypothetical protein [Pseudomonas putida]MCI1037726.1 hypothetical protein [Pseudomonas putida]
MSDEYDPAAAENQNDPSNASQKSRHRFVFTEEMYQKLAESQQEYRREQRRQRRLEFSWISWFFDEYPGEVIYKPAHARRNTRQEMAYHRFRQMISWSFWSRMKSSTGIKLAAVGGLVAAFLQAAPPLKGAEAAAVPLSWLLLGGGFYLLAVICFELRCPVLLKRTLAAKDEYLGIEGRRWLLALVEDELRRWWSVRLYDLEVGNVRPESGDYRIARGIFGYGAIAAYGGFGEYASSRIEYALDEYVQLTSASIWKEDFKSNEYSKFTPGYLFCTLNTPLRRLDLGLMSASEVEMAQVGQEGDLVVSWFDSTLTFQSELPTHRNLRVSDYAEGLSYLFQTDASALIFTGIIAQWQNTMRPWSRLLLIGLFLASGSCFIWFVVLQLRVLVPILI